MKSWDILITGGSSGIGYATAKLLVEAGARVHLTGRRKAALEDAARDFGSNACIYPGDIASRKDMGLLLQNLSTNTSKLDAVVLNAAKYGFQPLMEMSPEELEAYFIVNSLSPVWLIQKTLPLLKAGAGKSIVTVSSTLSTRPVSGTAAYASSKAALNSLTQSLAIELATYGIRCNSVLPGVVDTPIHEPKGPNDPSKEEKLAQLGPMHLLGRAGKPEEVAETIKFLISSDSAWTTGGLYAVDGGISLV